MNPVAEEIASYLGSAEMTEEEFLEHYGKGHLDGGHSGRFPWGSGKDAYQRYNHAVDFLSRVELLKKNGWKETPENIKKEFGLKYDDYRKEKSICNDDRKMALVSRAIQLRDNNGYSPTEIGKRMGVNESTVRGWFAQEQQSKFLKTRETAEFLKKRLDELPEGKKMIDVGKGVDRELNISKTKLDTALYMLKREGYNVYGGREPQLTNKNQSTTLKVLAAPGVEHKEIFVPGNVQTLNKYISRDGGDTYEKKFHYPASMDSKRLKIRYADDVGPDGFKGVDKDGLIEIRRGVQDLSLGKDRYSQVRILVDGTHYMKGMAVYSDDLPDGVDIIFNTNKKRGTAMTDVLKKIKPDPENPFGSNIKDADQGGQYWYTDKKTGKRKLGLINKRAGEGDWTDWTDCLPSQFLSKQSKQMAKKQLDIAKADKEAEYSEICSLNNPTIKKYYLNKFAEKCDAAAVDLKAAALPGQKYHVIIPVNGVGDGKIYAPRYKDGTKLALIRYPHAGTFEIPILTVDNKNKLARKIIGVNSYDAVGITSKVAARLSGADFDGDTVMCIPTHDRQGKVKITSTPELTGLIGFDPKFSYGPDPGSKTVDANGDEWYTRGGRRYKAMKDTLKQKEMGIISNLITDMTLQRAKPKEMERAVKHSMVVIDAEKHKLDYKQSEMDNNIRELKRLYQPKFDKNGNVIDGGGAFTIISKSGGEYRPLKRRGDARINMKGKEWYDPSKPEGSLIHLTARDKDLYYVDGNYNKKTKVRTMKTLDGKTISFNMDDAKARAKYDIAKKINPETKKEEPIITKDSKTGLVYFTNKDKTLKYKAIARTTNSTNMAETTDAYTLVSPIRHPMEILYADYANSMKALANKARIEMINTGNLKQDPKAKKIYAKEVSSLEAKLNNALLNAPRERAAARAANVKVKNTIETNGEMSKEDLKKLKQRSMTKARQDVGAIKRSERSIIITDKEWEAIQAGAISDHKLKEILDNSDPDLLRERAMPKERRGLTTAQINRIKAMSSSFTIAQIADKMGISPSAVAKYLKGAK